MYDIFWKKIYCNRGFYKLDRLYNRLRELRERENISQNALANTLGITRASVNAWEMGISAPNAQSLIMLAHYFGVSVDYLLGLDNTECINISKLNAKEKELICSMVRYLSSLREE